MTTEEIEDAVNQFRELLSMEGAEVSIEYDRPVVEVFSPNLFRRFAIGPELFATIRVKCPVAVETSK